MKVSGLTPHLVNTKLPISLSLTYPDSHCVVPDQDQFEGDPHLVRIFKEPFRDMEAAVLALAWNGGLSQLKNRDWFALPSFQDGRTSGYLYSLKTRIVAELRFGLTQTGHIAIQTLFRGKSGESITHFYLKNGKYAFSEPQLNPELVGLPPKIFEPRCPILNFLYVLADREYAQTQRGEADTPLLHLIENIIRKLTQTRKSELSFSLGIHDPIMTRVNEALLQIELDPVLTFEERRLQIRALKESRLCLVKTKCRVHGVSSIRLRIPLAFSDLGHGMVRFFTRPWSNVIGLLTFLVFEPVRAFFRMVKSNLGYSVALAVYSPFTFFFITQPMNPHAMRAVGAVRATTLEMMDSMRIRMGMSSGGVSKVTPGNSDGGSAKTYAAITPKTAGILISSDISEVSNQTWDERMSHFKDMQIAYESGLEIAPRLGRLEHIETQLNWPLILESAWMETSRYSAFANFILSHSSDYDAGFIQWIQKELIRLDQVQLYLWDRNIRFIQDHPYIVMDVAQEQPHSDPYAKRSLLILREMTRLLLNRHPDLVLPQGYETLMDLARKFELEYHAGSSVLDRLKRNSKVFSQSAPLEPSTLRVALHRHWEVLYLQQNHAQEAANAGLQLYVWSIRTVITLLQSLYSAKREELSMLSLQFKKGANPEGLSQNYEFKNLEFQSEAILHQLSLEFTSIKKELHEDLKKDIEAIQRETLIQGLSDSLSERSLLFKTKGQI